MDLLLALKSNQKEPFSLSIHEDKLVFGILLCIRQLPEIMDWHAMFSYFFSFGESGVQVLYKIFANCPNDYIEVLYKCSCLVLGIIAPILSTCRQSVTFTIATFNHSVDSSHLSTHLVGYVGQSKLSKRRMETIVGTVS